MCTEQLDALDSNLITLPEFVCRSSPRRPTYKANDSSDQELIELISPAHEFKRNLARGRVQQCRQELQHDYYKHTASRSSCVTPRNQRKPQRKVVKKSSDWRVNIVRAYTPTSMQHRCYNPRKPFRDVVRKTKSQEGDGQSLRSCKVRDHPAMKSHAAVTQKQQPVQEEEKVNELRHISKMWHQECQSSISIQQRLTNLLNTKYKRAFADGRTYSYSKCKNDDFKAEVGQIVKRLETAGAMQLPTLRVMQELAIESVDEVFGIGMGEEYLKLEMYYLQPNSKTLDPNDTPIADLVKEMAKRAKTEYSNVQNVLGFMLDQLSLEEFGRRAHTL